MKLDLEKAGSTTILSCGTTNCDYFCYVQQGIRNSNLSAAENIFNAFKKLAPTPPGDGWKLVAVDSNDYKQIENKKFYKINATFKFRRGDEFYSNDIRIEPEKIFLIYKMFQEAYAISNY